MAVPKKKVSKSKNKIRKSSYKIQKVFVSYEQKTGEVKLQHHLSLKDGYYRGNRVLKIKKK